MSGGELNYAYRHVEEAARTILGRGPTVRHRAFGLHLLKVAKALHDIEWVMSCDYGEGADAEAMAAVLTPGEVLQAATDEARTALRELQQALAKVEAGR